jgi:phage-related protein
LGLPASVRMFFGHALYFAQVGKRHDAAKALKGFSGAGVLEVVEDDAGGTYRAVYTVRFEQAVFVLHCFQKKSKSGIATPKRDIDIIQRRLKVAEEFAKELANDASHHTRD